MVQVIFVSQPSVFSFDLQYFLTEDNHTGGGVKIAIFGQSMFYLVSPRFLCRLTALIKLLQPFNVRACYIRKPSNLPHQPQDRHISTFRGYRILFSIRNPYINRFTNHFSIHSKPSYPQKVVLHSITARFCLRSYYSAI